MKWEPPGDRPTGRDGDRAGKSDQLGSLSNPPNKPTNGAPQARPDEIEVSALCTASRCVALARAGIVPIEIKTVTGGILPARWFVRTADDRRVTPEIEARGLLASAAAHIMFHDDPDNYTLILAIEAEQALAILRDKFIAVLLETFELLTRHEATIRALAQGLLRRWHLDAAELRSHLKHVFAPTGAPQ